MIFTFSKFIKTNYRLLFTLIFTSFLFVFSLSKSYLLFHTIIELQSIIIAFTVFIITWNSKKILENQYLFFVGIAYFFIGTLDLFHTLTFKGMNIIEGKEFYANQFWVATRMLEAITLVVGFYFNEKKKLNADILFLAYLSISTLIVMSILNWHIFPICYIEGFGQTAFKIYSEYFIIILLFLSASILFYRRHYFDKYVSTLLFFSIGFAILSEFCFTLYVYNYSSMNAIGHLFKVVSFYLIYKANVETGFTQPTALLFKNINDSEFRYRKLAENLPVLLFRYDANYNCIYNNADKFEIFDKSIIETLKGELKLSLSDGKKYQKPINKSINFINEKIKLIYDIQIITENRSNKDDEPSYLILCQDITKIKEAEEQLTELNATKDKFFSIIAHDLKNPFTSILASNEMIQKNAAKLSTEKIQLLAGTSYQTAKNAFSLLENLLTWSQVQTGSLKPQLVSINMKKFLQEVYNEAHSIALTKNIKIEIISSIDENFNADLNMLKTICRNLISNAIKFSYPESKITVSVFEEIEKYNFSIADSGVGIDEENLKKIFLANNNFVRQGTAKEKGTGLGLQLCKDFIQLHGGLFWVESEVGKGSIFHFSIPFFNKEKK